MGRFTDPYKGPRDIPFHNAQRRLCGVGQLLCSVVGLCVFYRAYTTGMPDMFVLGTSVVFFCFIIIFEAEKDAHRTAIKKLEALADIHNQNKEPSDAG